MSELNFKENSGQRFLRQLLTTASVLALMTSLASTDKATASESSTGKPAVWIELGGQLERMDQQSNPFLPLFTTNPIAGASPFDPVSPAEAQKSPGYALGGEGKISFEPRGSDWVFSIGVRYGRSNGNKHIHQALPTRTVPYAKAYGGVCCRTGTEQTAYPPFADVQSMHRSSHVIADFQAGKDVGLGMFGREASSVFAFGVRFAQIGSLSDTEIHARPVVDVFNAAANSNPPGQYLPRPAFNSYSASRYDKHSFHGIGPSLSWNASVPVAGHIDASQISLDLGAKAAILFGRQKKQSHQQSSAFYNNLAVSAYPPVLYRRAGGTFRSHSVVVPDVGGFAAVSFRLQSVKMSLGYRGDFFFGAMDTGIDTRQRSDIGFHGPYATISIGLGG